MTLAARGFTLPVNYSVGDYPQSVTSGDFDGDGNLDLVVVNIGDNNLSILLGTGDGTFADAVNYNAVTSPLSLASGDFDGDGNLDLATVNGGTDNVSIIMNIELDDTFPFAGGTGTEEDPFQISTCQQLQDMNFTPDGGVTYTYLSNNYYFILNNDIDCSNTVNWNDGAGFMPIGNTLDYNSELEYGEPFIGTFDGNNHAISNLYINRPDFTSVGLFGVVSGSEEQRVTIKDLTIANANITASNGVGILSGLSEYTDITNCHTSGQVTDVSESPEDSGVGGIVGIASNVKISNSSSQAQVEGLMAGGIASGFSVSNIENSYATGEVTSAFLAGGLIGYSEGGSVYNSYVTGDVNGSVSGGLVGFSLASQIFNSYSTGNIAYVDSLFINAMFNVKLTHIAGGLVGGFVYLNSEDPISNYIHNSGWYKSEANSNFSAVGTYGYQGESGFIPEGSNAEVSYSETNNTVFYLSSHGVYAQGEEESWSFDGNPWYEYSNDYPKFTEQQKQSTPTKKRIHSSGSSVGSLSTFYQQQIERAKSAGQDATSYQEALNKLVPSTDSANSPQASRGQDHRTLKQGMQGNDVKELQVYLNNHNYPLTTEGTGSNGHETIYFGSKTKQAVIKFQLANKLVGDGIVGPLTWSYIK